MYANFLNYCFRKFNNY